MPITAETLKEYLNPVFLETGTFKGDGTMAAVEAGFDSIYTIEVFSPLARAAAQRFRDYTRVQCFDGPSIFWMPHILNNIKERTTFWLDSHTCGGETGGAWDTPLIGELRLIATHAIKNHTILIDDLHLCTFELPGMPEIEMRIKQINPDYKLSYAPSAEPSLGMDILVATV